MGMRNGMVASPPGRKRPTITITGAAVESFRNEMVEANQRSQQILLKEMSDVDIASPRLR